MAKKTEMQQSNGGNWQPTYIKYNDMNDREKSIYRQGCKTVEVKVKKNLGLVPPPKRDA